MFEVGNVDNGCVHAYGTSDNMRLVPGLRTGIFPPLERMTTLTWKVGVRKRFHYPVQPTKKMTPFCLSQLMHTKRIKHQTLWIKNKNVMDTSKYTQAVVIIDSSTATTKKLSSSMRGSPSLSISDFPIMCKNYTYCSLFFVCSLCSFAFGD